MVYVELDKEKNLLVWFLTYDERFKIENAPMTLGISVANWKPSDVELFYLLQFRLRGVEREKIVKQMANILIRYGYEVRNLTPKQTKTKKRGCHSCGKRRKKK